VEDLAFYRTAFQQTPFVRVKLVKPRGQECPNGRRNRHLATFRPQQHRHRLFYEERIPTRRGENTVAQGRLDWLVTSTPLNKLSALRGIEWVELKQVWPAGTSV
jgi:hypothetical protein